MRISDWSSDVCSSDLDGRTRLHRHMHETVTEALQLIALPIRLARTPYALREDDDRLALLKHLHAIERIADHRPDTGQHVADPWHRRKEELDHRARRARAIRVHDRQGTGQNSSH